MATRDPEVGDEQGGASRPAEPLTLLHISLKGCTSVQTVLFRTMVRIGEDCSTFQSNSITADVASADVRDGMRTLNKPLAENIAQEQRRALLTSPMRFPYDRGWSEA